ncbi:MAG: ChaN family lipoprotein [Pirellulales bacterium]|nr:ChaN family lipoprotein [Pirellulales bacterium]
MLNTLLAALLLVIPADSSVEQESQDANVPRILSPRADEFVSIRDAAEELARRDVVFLGEEHDSTPGHEMQLALIRDMHKERADLVISMEMFERDVQGVVDDYLGDRIDEEEFLKHARPWPSYADHYRPIIEYAKEHGVDVIAGNVPRRIASEVAKGNAPATADAVYIARQTSAPEDGYWENFQGAMSGHGGTDNGDAVRLFYQAQCLKDDAMAEAIVDYLAVHPHRQPLVIHLCGKFHSDGGLGTVSRLVDRSPLLQVGVVSMETIEAGAKPTAASYVDQAHFVVIINEPAEGDSAEAAKSTSRDDG